MCLCAMQQQARMSLPLFEISDTARGIARLVTWNPNP